MIQRYIVYKQDLKTEEWLKVSKFGGIDKAENCARKIEASFPYAPNPNRLYTCIEPTE
jgi:hypothetical protein